MEKMRAFVALAVAAGVALAASLAVAGESVRVGVLKFGTVNWEIDTVRHYELDKANGIEIEVVPLAGNEATYTDVEATVQAVTLDNLRAYAETGVHRISLGALTHSVIAADVALELDEAPRPPSTG